MSKLLLKYQCPVCGKRFKTEEFCISRSSIFKQGKHIFSCSNCNTKLTISPKFYKYMSLFFVYFFFVLFAGYISSYFITNLHAITVSMLCAYIFLLPIFYLLVIHNKAIKNEST